VAPAAGDPWEFGGGGERRRLLASRGSDRLLRCVRFSGALVPLRLLSCHVPVLDFVSEQVGRMDAVRQCPPPRPTARHQPTPLPAEGWVQGVRRASACHLGDLQVSGGTPERHCRLPRPTTLRHPTALSEDGLLQAGQCATPSHLSNLLHPGVSWDSGRAGRGSCPHLAASLRAAVA